MDQVSPFSLIILTSVIAFFPIIVGIGTSYLKVSIVLGVLKNALGTQQVPSQLVVMSLSVGLSIFIMAPQLEQTIVEVEKVDWQQVQKKPVRGGIEAFKVLIAPWEKFLKKHAGEREIKVLENISKEIKEKDQVEGGATQEVDTTEEQEISSRVLLLAYILSELKEAFSMAFVVLLPFLVIDLIVANILVGLGMFMVSPVMISLPLKILVFVLSDAWLLLMKGLILSYY